MELTFLERRRENSDLFGSASSDLDGTIVAYEWFLGNIVVATAQRLKICLVSLLTHIGYLSNGRRWRHLLVTA